MRQTVRRYANLFSVVEGDRGAGARENRVGRQDRKRREAGVLKRREAREKFKANFCYLLSCYIFSKSTPQIVMNLASTEQTSKRKFALGEPLEVIQTKQRVTFGEIVNPFSVGYVIRHKKHAWVHMTHIHPR